MDSAPYRGRLNRVEATGSSRLWSPGDVEAVAARVRQHLDADDHVAAHPFATGDGPLPRVLEQLRGLSQALSDRSGRMLA